MEFICPTCNWPVNSTNINVITDLAKCEHCGSIHRASSLVSEIDEKTLKNPPVGSKIELTKESGEDIKLFMPKTGFKRADIPQLIFTLFWLVFIAFWTWSALQALAWFAVYAIPFWLIGLAMLAGLINAINETQTITVNNSTLTLFKERPFRSKKYEFKLQDVQSIKITHVRAEPFSSLSNPRYIWRLQWTFGAGHTMPAIISGKGTQYFFEAANDAEQEWAIKFLENRLKQAKR
jgi:hypothetical protein